MHNLKSVDVDIPHSKFVVVTGLSGSGYLLRDNDDMSRVYLRMHVSS